MSEYRLRVAVFEDKGHIFLMTMKERVVLMAAFSSKDRESLEVYLNKHCTSIGSKGSLDGYMTNAKSVDEVMDTLKSILSCEVVNIAPQKGQLKHSESCSCPPSRNSKGDYTIFYCTRGRV